MKKYLTIDHIVGFLDQVIAWAKKENNIAGLALVGSYARNQATDRSDIDLIILTDNPKKYLRGREWLSNFGHIVNVKEVNYGAVTSLHVSYLDSHQVEFGIALCSWAATPVDKGTEDVATDGIVLLYDPNKLFFRLMKVLKNKRHQT